jgi:release factor glutamine methyltransferase
LSIPDVTARLRAAGCVFAEDEAALLVDAAAGEELESLIRRRVAGEPLEVVLGWAAFAGRRLAVAPGVFVPRRRTELLAGEALHGAPAGGLVADLCCGVGAVGAVLLTSGRRLRVHSCDIDAAAVRCAERNLAPLGGVVHWGNLFAALPAGLRGRFDVVTANAPYVPSSDVALMPREAREYEPRHTLDGGPDGLAIARRILAAAASWLRPGGRLLIETSVRQAPELAKAFGAAGFAADVLRSEELDATVVSGAGNAVRRVG